MEIMIINVFPYRWNKYEKSWKSLELHSFSEFGSRHATLCPRVYINIKYIGVVGHLSCSTSPLCWAAPRSSPTWGWQSDPAQALQYSLSTLTGDSTSCQVPGYNNNLKIDRFGNPDFQSQHGGCPVSLGIKRTLYKMIQEEHQVPSHYNSHCGCWVILLAL